MLIERVKEAATQIFSTRREIVVAYLFGSILRTPDFNDIDIGLLLDDGFRPHALYEPEIIGEFEDRIDHSFDIRILNGRSIRFLFQVISNSQVLYVADEQKRVAFEKRVMIEYFDMKYYYERYDHQRREHYVA